MAVLGHLEQPVTKSGSAPVPSRVAQGVRRGEYPEPEVNGEPATSIVLRVAVLWVFVARENILQRSIGEDTALGAADYN